MTWQEEDHRGLGNRIEGLAGEVLTPQTAQSLAGVGKPLVFFIIAIIIDIIGCNIPYELDVEGNLTSNYWYIHGCFNSLSFVGYILFSFFASQKYSKALKIITFNWLGFAVGDFAQELLSENEMYGLTYWVDWGVLGFFVLMTILYFSFNNHETK